MTACSILSAFQPDPLALDFARRGDLQAASLCRAAHQLDLPARALYHDAGPGGAVNPGWWLAVDLPGRIVHFQAGRILVGPPGTPLEQCRYLNAASQPMANDKLASKIVLGILGFPVPEGMAFPPSEAGAAIAYALSRRGPVCLKPVDGSLGEGVFPKLTNRGAIEDAVKRISAKGLRTLVEDHVSGQAVRFFYIHPRVAGFRVDRPANVVGNGRSTILQLLARKNRLKHQKTGQGPVTIGRLERAILARQGLAETSIPPRGRLVQLRQASNAALGGDSLVGIVELHPGYAGEIERLCQALPGMRVAAVDTVLSRPDEPPAAGNWAILELNASPGMVQFRFPWAGEPLDLAPAILRSLLPGGGCHDGG